MRNSQKSNRCQNNEICQSDDNNNLSQTKLDIPDTESFMSPKHAQRTNTRFGESLNWELSSQSIGMRGYSHVQGNFESKYSSTGYDVSEDNWWPARTIASGDPDGKSIINVQMHSQHRRPLISDNHHSYAATNDYAVSEPETLQSQFYSCSNGYSQQHPTRPMRTHYQPPENFDNHTRPDEAYSSVVYTSPTSISNKSQNSISKQREFLALEQKRLEDHYATLQGQLLEDFQKRQQELIEVYNQSLETQSSNDDTLKCILQRSLEYDSDATIVSNGTDKENLTVVPTTGLPQSPFGINIKNHSTSSRNVEVKKNCRSTGKSIQKRRQGTKTLACPLSPTGRSNNSARQSSTLPSDRKLRKNSSTRQSYVSYEQRYPRNDGASQKVLSFQNVALPDARKSFNSEASAQEYMEMPRFRGNFAKPEVLGNSLEERRSDNRFAGKSCRNSVKNFSPNIVTSPKQTQLNSFQSPVSVCRHSLTALNFWHPLILRPLLY